MSIKRTLVGNLIGFTRDGHVFTTVTVPGEGYFLNFGIATGKEISGVLPVENNWLHSEDLKPKRLMHINNQNYDIVSLYRPTNALDLFTIHNSVEMQHRYANSVDDINPIWKEEKPAKTVSSNSNQSSGDDPSRTINVKTEVWIEINGKKVDPNNMTEDERKILVGLGILI